MFEYSFSTVFIAILASNLLLILITVFFQSKKVMINAGYKLLALFIGFTALRFLLPFELPFATTIQLPAFISEAVAWIRHPFYTIFELEISVWTIFEGIWIIGFVINLIGFIREHAKARYFILANSLDATTEEPYASLLDEICRERNKKNRFQILTMTGIDRPMLYGIFSPRILIPENMQASKEDLYYSLVHEASHHFHHDLLIKKIIRLITMVYWWNPVCYLLNRKTKIILEMRVDDVLTKSDERTIANYLHCLIKLGEQALEKTALPDTVTMSILSDSSGDLMKRSQMLMAVNRKKNYILNILLLVLVIGIYSLSYIFIFEAYYVSDDMAGTSIGQTLDNIYAIIKENGTYDIYFDHIFIENTDSLELYSSDIPIYTEKEITNEDY